MLKIKCETYRVFTRKHRNFCDLFAFFAIKVYIFYNFKFKIKNAPFLQKRREKQTAGCKEILLKCRF